MKKFKKGFLYMFNKKMLITYLLLLMPLILFSILFINETYLFLILFINGLTCVISAILALIKIIFPKSKLSLTWISILLIFTVNISSLILFLIPFIY